MLKVRSSLKQKMIVVLMALGVVACGGASTATPRLIRAAPQTVSEAPSARRLRIEKMLPKVRQEVLKTLKANAIPAASFAVLDRGHVAWAHHHGRTAIGGGQPVNARTLYRIGSITKTMAAMSALILSNRGELDLDAPATEYLPELSEVIYPTADSPPITVRHLLTHTSGLPRVGGLDYASARRGPVSRSDVLEALVGAELKHAPGTKNDYSNLAFAVLGLIIENVAEAPFVEVLTERVLRPLGMRGARWDGEAIGSASLATGYHWDGKRLMARHHWRLGAAEAMGGMYATLDDMIRYAGYHMTAWPPGSRPDMPPLSNAALRESHLLGGYQLPGRSGSGFGWGVARTKRIEHLVFHVGATHQYTAVVMFAPWDEVAVVALANTNRAVEPFDKLGARILGWLQR